MENVLRKRPITFLLLLSVVVSIELLSCRPLYPVFPNAEGFGTDTPAGRGGQIVKVTNLNDSGPGSLRAAVELPVPRIIVFEVSGTIRLSTDLSIKNPYVTIAGQTAPSPGVTLRGATVDVRTHDVLLKHLRIRVGDEFIAVSPESLDGIRVLEPSYNVVIDHISTSWAIDENGSTNAAVHDITYSNSIFSEGLNNSFHPDGPHSMGVLVGDYAQNVALIGNLMAHNGDRNPLVKGNASAIVLNNVMYDCINYMSIGGSVGPSYVSIVGNVFLYGPSSRVGKRAVEVKSNSTPGTQIYLSDNDAPNTLVGNFAPFEVLVDSPPIWLDALTVRPHNSVERWVLANAGSRPAERDLVDARIVSEVVKRTGSIIDSQSDVGGWPVLAKNVQKFEVPANPHADDNGNGYTNIEEVLQQMAKQVEGR